MLKHRDNPMSKLLAQYRAAPTLKNAQKVRAYERKHPMAVCMLTADESETLKQAVFEANSADFGTRKF